MRLISGSEALQYANQNPQTVDETLYGFFRETMKLSDSDIADRIDEYRRQYYQAFEQNLGVICLDSENDNFVGQAILVQIPEPQTGFKSDKVIYPVNEIRRARVAPDYRGKGIYPKLIRPKIIEVGEANNPGSVVTVTKQAIIRRYSQEQGWAEYGEAETALMYGFDPSRIDELPPIDRDECQGYTMLVKPR
jgi:hypothetical protein